MRVAIAHDWLVGYAGSERVVAELLQVFPDASLLTTVVDRDALPPALHRAQPSFLQRVPAATRHHELLLPLMPLAWRLADPGDVDVVISSSHACAKAIRAPEGVPHVCYCHTPMRYAWDFGAERERFPALVRPPARVVMAAFRAWDRATADRVTQFVANSTAVARRIRRSYGRDAIVVHPPVATDYFIPGGERGADFLFVGRLIAYKRVDLLVEAFAGLPHRLLVAGSGRLERRLRSRAPANVVFLGTVAADELRRLYRSARAFVFPANEDFGIAMAEAQACGTPVIAAAQGGARDIVEDGVTGWLVEPTVEAVRAAVWAAAEVELDRAAIRRSAERFAGERYRERMRHVVETTVATTRAAPSLGARAASGRG